MPIFWAKPGRYTLTYYRYKGYMYYVSRTYSIGSAKPTVKAEKISYPIESFAYLRGQPSDYPCILKKLDGYQNCRKPL